MVGPSIAVPQTDRHWDGKGQSQMPRSNLATDFRFTGVEVAWYLNDLNGFDLTVADMSRQP